jgi:hypothetical protein
VENLLDVARDPRPGVLVRIVRRVLAVIADVERDELEALASGSQNGR